MSENTMIEKMEAPQWFAQERFGMFIHWGLYALPARHEWVKMREEITTADYQTYFDHFDPDLYDPEAWVGMAKAAGMKYIVITTKHHDGFCLWDSKFTEYKSTNTPCGRDLIRELVDACRDAGMRIGFYYSLLDWHHPHFVVDKMHPMRNNEAERAENVNRDMSIYAKYMRDQVAELLTEFAPVEVIWFDFSYPVEDGKCKDDWESEKLYAVVKEHAPEIVLGNRLDLPEAGGIVTPEQWQPREPMRDSTGELAIWEACQTFSGSWGYFRDEYSWKTTQQLLYMLIESVSNDGNMLLNVGPNGRGEFDHRAQDKLSDLARWMRVHQRSIYGCGKAPEGIKTPADCRLTYNPETNRLYLHILSWPYRHIFLDGLEDKIEYAQFLHDASEVKKEIVHEMNYGNPGNMNKSLALHLPVTKPDFEIPVIEIYLK